MTKSQKSQRAPRYRSPWPRGSRIDRKNDPIAAFPDFHPAKRLLLIHSQCRRECVGREIAFIGREDEAFDQQFTSQVDANPWRFSAFAYIHLSFTLILTEWLEHPRYMTDDEQAVLANLPKLRMLLAECQAAAERDANSRVLELLPLPEAYCDAREASIRARLEHDGIGPIP